MDAKSVQSGAKRPPRRTHVCAHRWPSKCSPYICSQRWQLRRQALRCCEDPDTDAADAVVATSSSRRAKTDDQTDVRREPPPADDAGHLTMFSRSWDCDPAALQMDGRVVVWVVGADDGKHLPPAAQRPLRLPVEARVSGARPKKVHFRPSSCDARALAALWLLGGRVSPLRQSKAQTQLSGRSSSARRCARLPRTRAFLPID